MARILVSLVFILLFPTELTGIKCYTCDGIPDCNKEKNEVVCAQEPMVMDKCMLMTDNENQRVARSCSNDKLCGIAGKTCKDLNCDLKCCATDLCNLGSTVSPFHWLSVLTFVAILMIYYR